MRITFIIALLLLTVSVAYADRICTQKSTGKFLEYQSGDAPLGTLTENAVTAGYDRNDVIEKYITTEEWLVYREENIDKPAREKAKQKEDEKKAKEEDVQQSLGLSDEEFEDLKEVLK